MSAETLSGKVKFFNSEKGYGFITEESGKDYFVHKTNTLDNIKKDDLVTFELEQGNKGLKAVNVKRKKVETIKS